MKNIILDTDVLADFLGQYFFSRRQGTLLPKFEPLGKISDNYAENLNDLLYNYETEGTENLIITSAFSFIEIIRKWDKIVEERYSPSELHAFIINPPEWFSIAPVDEDLLPFYIDIPIAVKVGGRIENIEWTDAIHFATKESRGSGALLATTDRRLLLLKKCMLQEDL